MNIVVEQAVIAATTENNFKREHVIFQNSLK